MDRRFYDMSQWIHEYHLDGFANARWWRFYFGQDDAVDWKARRMYLVTVEAWCRENLGRRKRAWVIQNGVVCIRSPRQATAFKLRWC